MYDPKRWLRSICFPLSSLHGRRGTVLLSGGRGMQLQLPKRPLIGILRGLILVQSSSIFLNL